MPQARRGAPRASRRKNRKDFVAIPFTENLTLSTLANSTVFTRALVTFGEDIFILSVDATWTLREATAGEGPIAFGFSHGDLTVTEVKEALEAELTDPDDIIQKEKARRPVRRSGAFHGLSTEEAAFQGDVKRTTVKFSVGDGHALNAWAMNRSGLQLTGGQIVACDGVIYGRWQR